MKKGINNVNAVARKLEPTFTRVTNEKLKITREEKQKREEIVEK